MKSALFVLGLALCCAVQAIEDERFENVDHNKLKGDWYTIAMATDCRKMKKMVDHMPVAPVKFEPQSADEIKMRMDVAVQGECKAVNLVLKRENNVFTTRCMQGGKKTVEYVHLNGNSVSTSVTVSHKNGQCTIATVAVRDLGDTQGALEVFQAFVERVGPKGEEVHVLPTEGMCPRSS